MTAFLLLKLFYGAGTLAAVVYVATRVIDYGEWFRFGRGIKHRVATRDEEFWKLTQRKVNAEIEYYKKLQEEKK